MLALAPVNFLFWLLIIVLIVVVVIWAIGRIK